MISRLPLSESARKSIIQMFDRAFISNDISEEDFTRIVDFGLNLDDCRQTALRLLHKSAAYSNDELRYIFSTEQQLREQLAKLDNLHFLRPQIQKLYEEEIKPLVLKAKVAIQADVRHFTSAAAAERGKALQVGLQTASLLEQGQLKLEKNESSENVYLFPSANAVLKQGSRKSRGRRESGPGFNEPVNGKRRCIVF